MPISRQVKAQVICNACPISNNEIAVDSISRVWMVYQYFELLVQDFWHAIRSVGLLAGLPCFNASRAARPN